MHSPGAGEYWAAPPAPPAPPCALHPAPPAPARARLRLRLGLRAARGPGLECSPRPRPTCPAPRGLWQVPPPLSRPGPVPGPEGSGLPRGAHIRPPRGSDRPEGGSWEAPGSRRAGRASHHPQARGGPTGGPGRDRGPPRGPGGGGAPGRKVWKREGKGHDPPSWGPALGAGHQRPHPAGPGRAQCSRPLGRGSRTVRFLLSTAPHPCSPIRARRHLCPSELLRCRERHERVGTTRLCTEGWGTGCAPPRLRSVGAGEREQGLNLAAPTPGVP